MFNSANAACQTTESGVHSIHRGLIDQYPNEVDSSERDSIVSYVEVVCIVIFVDSSDV